MFYVLDQNVMRGASLAEIVRTQPEASFIVPDTALLEMAKSEKWEDTMRGSFATLTSAVDRTFLSLSVYEAIRIEQNTLTSIDRALLLPIEFTEHVRELIYALASGSAEPKIDEIRASIDAFRSDLLEKEADAVGEKHRLEPMIATMNRELGPTMANDLCAGRMGYEARLGFIQVAGDVIFARDLGVDPKAMPEFRSSKPLLLRQVYLMLRNVIRWAQQGGVHTARPNRILNDRLDQEYVLIASFFDKLLTNDKEAIEADADLRLLLNEERREEFQDAFGRHNSRSA